MKQLISDLLPLALIAAILAGIGAGAAIWLHAAITYSTSCSDHGGHFTTINGNQICLTPDGRVIEP